MKTSYLLKSNTRRKGGWKGIIIPTLIFMLLLSIRILFPQFLSETFFGVAQAAWTVRDTITDGLSEGLVYLSSKALLSGQIGDLKEELENAQELRIQNNILREENMSLRNLLGRDDHNEWVVAGVVAKPPRTPFDVLLLDAGKENGIANGMMVVSGRVFLGKIIETLDGVSKAELFSLGGKSLEGVLLRTDTSLSLTGKGGGNFEAEVPRSFDIEVGDAVSLPGLDTLLIADVLSIESEVTGAFKTILLRTPININGLRRVEIKKYTEW